MPLMGTDKSYNPTSFRLGYGNYEKDDEVYGFNGSLLDMSSRFMDGLIPVPWKTDQLESSFAYQSPYTYGENRPIDGIDLDGMEWTSTTKCDPNTGKTTINNKLKIQIVVDGEIVNGLNRVVYAEAMKKRFETQYTQFDKETNTQYTAELEYDFVDKASASENKFVVELYVNDYTTNPPTTMAGRGQVESIGNTQINAIKVKVGYKVVGPVSIESQNIDEVANTFVQESGHTLGLLHPNGPYINAVAPDIQQKHDEGTLSPNNFMYHGGGDTYNKQIEISQIQGGTERIEMQQNSPENAGPTEDIYKPK